MPRIMRLRAKTAVTRSSPEIVSREEITLLAYALFEQRGSVHGHALEDWLEAERRLRSRRRSGGNGR